MRAHIVVGLGWGDEGKGITTDFLTQHRRNACVVRFSGGQQAGHTVVRGNKRHIFASYTVGAMSKLPSFISEYCTFYPPFVINEEKALNEIGIFDPKLVIHPLAMLTTPYDIAYNRVMEKVKNHGSCGMGIAATMKRNKETPYKLYATDVMYASMLVKKLQGILEYYSDILYKFEQENQLAMVGEFKSISNSLFQDFFSGCKNMSYTISSYDYLLKFSNVIFEGSQGIMLDMDHGIFPNVTYGNTTSKNAIEICSKLGIERRDISIYYVTRCYTTRHGNGWTPSITPIDLVNNENETNVWNKWQTSFKTSELDYNILRYALKCDEAYSYECDKSLVVTCLDQRPSFTLEKEFLPPFRKIYSFSSPDGSKDFKIMKDFTIS